MILLLIYNNKYDLIITIDSPDFNYPLAKKVKNKNNIPNATKNAIPTPAKILIFSFISKT